MSTNDSSPSPYFPGTVDSFLPQIGSEYDSSKWLASMAPLGLKGLNPAAIPDTPIPPIAKYERMDALADQMNPPKGEFDSHPLDIKAVSDTQDWNSSQDIVNIVLGGDLAVPEFDIRFDDDLYIVANQESANNIFPVIPDSKV